MYRLSRALRAILLVSFYNKELVVGASLADFDPTSSPNGEGCVDPQGFRNCFQGVLENFVDCGTNWCKTQTLMSENECLSGCKTTQMRDDLLCWVQSCWNQIYSCEYQISAFSFLARAGNRKTVGGGIPGYPAPDGVAGACSCNLGYVEGNATVGTSLLQGCIPVVYDSAEAGRECSCCSTGFLASSLSICPGADLSFMDFAVADLASAVDIESPDNCAILSDGAPKCESNYNISFSEFPMIINPKSLPAQGTIEPTNLPGNPFTEAPDSILTVSLDDLSYTTVITLATGTPESPSTEDSNASTVTTSILEIGTKTNTEDQPTKTSAAGRLTATYILCIILLPIYLTLS